MTALIGAEQPGPDARRLQNAEQVVGGGRLAVGAGDADHDQIAAGKALPGGRQPRFGDGRILDLQIDDIIGDGGGDLRRRPLGDDQPRPVVDGPANVRMAVTAGAHAGDKRRAVVDFGRLFSQPGEGDVGTVVGGRLGVAGAYHDGRPAGQELFELSGVVAHRWPNGSNSGDERLETRFFREQARWTMDVAEKPGFYQASLLMPHSPSTRYTRAPCARTGRW